MATTTAEAISKRVLRLVHVQRVEIMFSGHNFHARAVPSFEIARTMAFAEWQKAGRTNIPLDELTDGIERMERRPFATGTGRTIIEALQELEAACKEKLEAAA